MQPSGSCSTSPLPWESKKPAPSLRVSTSLSENSGSIEYLMYNVCTYNRFFVEYIYAQVTVHDFFPLKSPLVHPLLNFDPFLSFIKWQNNPKYGNLSRNFHIYLIASGEGRGGSIQAVSLTAFSQYFFDAFP